MFASKAPTQIPHTKGNEFWLETVRLLKLGIIMQHPKKPEEEVEHLAKVSLLRLFDNL